MIKLSDFDNNLLIKSIKNIFLNSKKDKKNYHINNYFRSLRKIKILNVNNYIKNKTNNFHDLMLKFFSSNNFSLFKLGNIFSDNIQRIIFFNGTIVNNLSNYNSKTWKIINRKKENNNFLFNKIDLNSTNNCTEYFTKEDTNITLLNDSNIDKPLYIIHLNINNFGKESLNISCYDFNINIKDKLYGNIIEIFLGLENTSYVFNNIKTSLTIGQYSKLDYKKVIFEGMYNLHLNKKSVILNDKSSLNSQMLFLSSGLTHNKVDIKKHGKESLINLNTLSISSGNSLNLINTYTEHNSSHFIGKQLHKIISLDNSYNVFNGLIKIFKDIFDINSRMEIKGLILNNLAYIESNPNLEIYSNQVKCYHSVAISKIDEKQIFYLRTRGISEKNAKIIFIKSFIQEVIDNINDVYICNLISKYIYNILEGKI